MGLDVDVFGLPIFWVIAIPAALAVGVLFMAWLIVRQQRDHACALEAIRAAERLMSPPLARAAEEFADVVKVTATAATYGDAVVGYYKARGTSVALLTPDGRSLADLRDAAFLRSIGVAP